MHTFSKQDFLSYICTLGLGHVFESVNIFKYCHYYINGYTNRHVLCVCVCVGVYHKKEFQQIGVGILFSFIKLYCGQCPIYRVVAVYYNDFCQEMYIIIVYCTCLFVRCAHREPRLTDSNTELSFTSMFWLSIFFSLIANLNFLHHRLNKIKHWLVIGQQR